MAALISARIAATRSAWRRPFASAVLASEHHGYVTTASTAAPGAGAAQVHASPPESPRSPESVSSDEVADEVPLPARVRFAEVPEFIPAYPPGDFYASHTFAADSEYSGADEWHQDPWQQEDTQSIIARAAVLTAADIMKQLSPMLSKTP